MTRDKAFDATMKTGPKLYGAKMVKIIAASGNGDSKTHVIFMDKNHPSNALDRLVGDIVDNTPNGVNLKKVYLTPAQNPMTTMKGYPFSASFMLQCMLRGQTRSVHPTLDNSDPVKMLEIQTMFINFYKNVDFNQSLLDRYSVDNYLSVGMTSESIEIP